GTLYARHGYRAPFIFSLVLVGVDLVMRLILIEKHQALAWIRAGVEIPNFEAPGYVDPMSLPDPTAEPDNTVSGKPAPIPLAGSTPPDEEARAAAPERAIKEEQSKVPTHWRGLWYMIKDPRALTSFALTFLNGLILGGLLDTSMTLHLYDAYGLSSFGAGLVFIGAVAPTFIGSPLAGWIVDKYGTKWIMFVGVALSVPAYPLLIIHGPLALFIFFLVIVGLAISFFLTPVTVDLNLVAADTPGLTTPHVFGAFNMAYSIGSFVGPIIAGQVIAAVQIAEAWVILTILSAALSVATLPFIFLYVGGGRPRWGSLRGVGRREEIEQRNATGATEGEGVEGGG
ncbi:hypothetical protein JCM5296_005485, partial [Sporobolomyces johnsonii]